MSSIYLNPRASSANSPAQSTSPAIEAFHKTLPHYAETPLIPLVSLAQELGISHVFLKDESSRFGLPSFKILGASWAIAQEVAQRTGLSATASLPELCDAAQRARIKLVACSEGNWGHAVARMANYLGVPATIYVPKGGDEGARERIAGEGADVRVAEGKYDDAVQEAEREGQRTGGMLCMDVSWKGYEEFPRLVTNGYGTMLVEVEMQLKNSVGTTATHVIVSVGVGSWAHAVAQYYKVEGGRTKMVAVEPESAACLKKALEAGEAISIETGTTIMNGMNCGRVSNIAWPVLRDSVDAAVTVSDIEAHENVVYLQRDRVSAGPCGAATVAALKKLVKENVMEVGSGTIILFSTEGARPYPIPT